MDKPTVLAQKRTYVTVTAGGAGYFAVAVWWNPDGFWEPWETGIGRYATRREAAAEARDWAEAENLPYFPVTFDQDPGLRPQVRAPSETLSAFTVLADHFLLPVAKP